MGLFFMVPFSFLGTILGMVAAVVLGLVLLVWIGEAVLTALFWIFWIGLGIGALVFLFRWIYRDKTPWHPPQLQPPPDSPQPLPRVPRGNSPSVVIIEGVQIVVQPGANLHIHLHAGDAPPNVRVVPAQSRPVRPQGEPAKPSPRIIPPQNGRGPTFGDWNDRYGGGDDEDD